MANKLEYPLIIEAYGPEILKENVEEKPKRLGWPRNLFGIELYCIGEADCDLEIIITDQTDDGNSMRFYADFDSFGRGEFIQQARKWQAKDEGLSIRIHNAFFFTGPKEGYSKKYKFLIKH